MNKQAKERKLEKSVIYCDKCQTHTDHYNMVCYNCVRRDRLNKGMSVE